MQKGFSNGYVLYNSLFQMIGHNSPDITICSYYPPAQLGCLCSVHHSDTPILCWKILMEKLVRKSVQVSQREAMQPKVPDPNTAN